MEASDRTLTFSWNSSPGAASYKGQLTYTDQLVTTVYECASASAQRSCTFEDLGNGKTYKFEVRSIKGNTQSAFSPPVKVAPRPPAVKLSSGWEDGSVAPGESKDFHITISGLSPTRSYKLRLDGKNSGDSFGFVQGCRHGFRPVDFRAGLIGFSAVYTLYGCKPTSLTAVGAAPDVKAEFVVVDDGVDRVLRSEDVRVRPTIDVVPLPGRKGPAEVAAGSECGQLYHPRQKSGVQWPKNPSSVGLVGNNPVSSAEVEIELDKILVENTSYEYRIEAQDSSGAYQKSDPSDVITLVDNPIARVSGDSRNAPSNKGQATIEWERIAGSDEYSIEYRRLGRTQKGGYHHSDVNWELNSYTYSSPNRIPTVVNVVDSSPSASGRMTHTITGLDLGEVYAVRLNYRTAAGWAHSARDAFVWPSASFPACGKRVATYPFFGHHASKEYSYRICEDTFPKDTRDAWENLIEHAFEQWEEATDGLVKMTPVDEDCTDLSPLEAYTAHRRPALARQQQSAKTKMPERVRCECSTFLRSTY